MAIFKYDKKNGGQTWYVDYYDHYYDYCGRRRRKRVVKAIGPSKREAEIRLLIVKAAQRAEQFHVEAKKESNITFSELLDQYTQRVQDQRFFQDSLVYLVPILREYFGEKMLSEVDYEALDNFREAREKTLYDTKQPRRRLNIEIEFLRRIFNKAVQWGMLERSPFKGKKGLFYKDVIERDRNLSEEEAKRLLEAYRNKYKRKILATAIYTGLPLREVCRLRWSDIDLKAGTLRVVQAKTRRVITISLNRNAIFLLKGHGAVSEYVFLNPRTRKPFKDIKASVELALKKAGIEWYNDQRFKIL
jgi:integrase